jgi:hypothetical protein
MSQHLRHEKDCLNCGATVEDRYCSHCGQENIVVKESFGHLFRHFFEDITHYDSKFFTTIKDLLLKPGFLTKEYLSGRRSSYLHPIRMYVFISFLYFLAAFTFSESGHEQEAATEARAAFAAKKEVADSLMNILQETGHTNSTDSIKYAALAGTISRLRLDSIHDKEIEFQLIGNIDYKFLKAYDEEQRALPEADRDKGIKPWLLGRWLKAIEHHGEATMGVIIEKTEHGLPKLMFLLLPLFALALKLFYDKKKYYYGDHAIFSLHFHSAVFLLFFIFALQNKLLPSWGLYFSLLELVLVFVYLTIALKNIYQQSFFITLLKVIGLGLLYGIFITAGFVVIGLSALLV